MRKTIKALVVIDVQNFFAVESAEKLPTKIAKYIQHTEYDHVLFTLMRYDPSSNFQTILNWKGPTKSPEIDLHPKIAPFSSRDVVFEKTTYSAFKSKSFKNFIGRHRITDIDLCGINIDACVLATAFEAFDLGFKTRILEDLSSVSSLKQKFSDAAKTIIARNLRRKS